MDDHRFSTAVPSDIVERIDDAVDLSRRLQAEAHDVCERSRALRDYLAAARTSRDECRGTVPSVSSSSPYVNTPVRQAEHV
ncbi:MAG: hypothetical protein QOC55_2813 [Thermoleophilaceae bacterium]|jgi:hypothetical protein|nr:hypothetical protein [Mycobacterium sp.]MEA2484866.1 hypothetical protein [Thermoleophilaceae bacterium]